MRDYEKEDAEEYRIERYVLRYAVNKEQKDILFSFLRSCMESCHFEVMSRQYRKEFEIELDNVTQDEIDEYQKIQNELLPFRENREEIPDKRVFQIDENSLEITESKNNTAYIKFCGEVIGCIDSNTYFLAASYGYKNLLELPLETMTPEDSVRLFKTDSIKLFKADSIDQLIGAINDIREDYNKNIGREITKGNRILLQKIQRK